MLIATRPSDVDVRSTQVHDRLSGSFELSVLAARQRDKLRASAMNSAPDRSEQARAAYKREPDRYASLWAQLARHCALILQADSTPSKKDKSPDQPTVITPGGPRQRDQVHPVAPGESVRRNPDGSYSVIPAPATKKNKRQRKNERKSSGYSEITHSMGGTLQPWRSHHA